MSTPTTHRLRSPRGKPGATWGMSICIRCPWRAGVGRAARAVSGTLRRSSPADISWRVNAREPHLRAVVGRCPAECQGGAPTRVSGCRTGMCLMVECRTGGDCARGSRGHGSGVIQSGGTGRAGRDESCRAGAVRAGLSTRIMCVSVGRKPCGMRTGGEGRSVSVRGGRAVVGGRGLGRRAGWHRSVELDGMSGAVIAVGRQLGGRAGWDLSAAPSG